MPFLNRARTLYDTGNTVGAVIALIEGLKRYPDHVDAFRWLIDLYCDEVQHTGLEDDIVRVFDSCPDPEGVYNLVYQRLLRAERHAFIRRLDRSRREAGLREQPVCRHASRVDGVGLHAEGCHFL